MGLGGGEGEELAWEDRMGGSQARQSMKQLTGAGKGGREKRRVSRAGVWDIWGCLRHPRALSGMRGRVRGLWAKVLGVLAAFSLS